MLFIEKDKADFIIKRNRWQGEDESDFMKELMIAGTVVLLIIFIAGIRWYVKRTIRQQIADYQDDLLEKHCEEVENMYRQMRGWRHDYHNHIQTMKAYLTM